MTTCFVHLSKYILQEKYACTDYMKYITIQSLCGSICKYNARISSDFKELSYSGTLICIFRTNQDTKKS